MRTLGVTGTNGKTTTTVLLDAIARAAGDRAAVLGTLSAGAHTTPEAPDLQAELARLRDGGVQTVAMEVSSHALAQHRVDGTWFAAVGFTNLGHDHLDFHQDRESYLEAKARLFTRAFSGRAAVHVADPAGTRLAIRAAAEGLDVLTVALDRADVDVRVTAHGGSGGRPDVVVQHEGNRVCFPAPLLGRFNVENVGVAAALALAGGLTLEAVAAGLGRELEVPGRVERIDGGQPFVVLVDYAHTPDALARLLVGTRELCGPGGRVLAVFGCGGDRDRTKRPAMGRAAGDLADVVVVTSDNPRGEDPAAIAAAVVEGLRDRTARWTVDLDRRGAIRTAVGSAAAGDVVVIAGKGHEQGQTAAGVTSPFDDRVVTREVLDTLAEEGRWN
jgi:UDP-N-acetylmuramoyl-L-alanyl-D-glutamate--2,6-diaminopimelate ligase